MNTAAVITKSVLKDWLCIWEYVYDITKIVSVQRRFTKRNPSVSHMSYSERLEFLGIESLEYRRLIADLTMMRKIVHNLVDVHRNALITLNCTFVARNLFLKLNKPVYLQFALNFCVCVVSMRGIIYQNRQDLQHLSVLLKSLSTCNLTTLFLSVLYPFY